MVVVVVVTSDELNCIILNWVKIKEVKAMHRQTSITTKLEKTTKIIIMLFFFEENLQRIRLYLDSLSTRRCCCYVG